MDETRTTPAKNNGKSEQYYGIIRNKIELDQLRTINVDTRGNDAICSDRRLSWADKI